MRPIAIQVVAHRFQHVLPGHIKRECRALWSEEADALGLEDPPRDVVEITVSGGIELFAMKVGIGSDLCIELSSSSKAPRAMDPKM